MSSNDLAANGFLIIGGLCVVGFLARSYLVEVRKNRNFRAMESDGIDEKFMMSIKNQEDLREDQGKLWERQGELWQAQGNILQTQNLMLDQIKQNSESIRVVDHRVTRLETINELRPLYDQFKLLNQNK
ncbi:hypothetical protein [Vibrio parahaemolyticus]|uniref:hypothetical protein n=1 Tax=Vibrio parahaemolyticus TaxID=670 RepID=UPI00226B7893|nr:hypothetical protein [Vibrio parahaemolyticus]MCX8941244.1 hypothetical protein [Vibrio parahaemolyticus]